MPASGGLAGSVAFFCWNRWPARPPFWGSAEGPTSLWWSREEHVDLLQPRRVWLVSWLGSWLAFLLQWDFGQGSRPHCGPCPPCGHYPASHFFSSMTVAAASAAWKFRPGEVCSGQVHLHVNMYDDAVSGTKKKKSHLTIHSSGNAYNFRQGRGSISLAWQAAKA